ncbi:ketose-bisphosphate aldolase [Microbacterium ginsengiterrae]|uniref:Ketose-bisphosphate aldolase n=1 Tax=Microbacterium ginsengiterrae TaxID=546115 RepID=A0A7W9FBC2_9MICO|nr:ketose-bisphosphate aldolase [Microbacterium ginsengiterrae]
MTHSTVLDIVADAKGAETGLGAFNVVLLEHAEAIAAGAERAQRPVIFQISQNCVAYHGALAPIARATLSIADAIGVPTLVHLDHADDVDLVHEAVDLGIQSVMFDASTLPYDENVALTREIADFCHGHGVLVEAELGEVGGKDGVHAPGARTDPANAHRFVEATGVDWLAVAVGTSHAMTTREAAVDRALIEQLASTVRVPLVLHGSSGLPDQQLEASVRAGMTKINISTHLNALFSGAVRERLAADPRLVDPRKYVAPGRAVVADEIERLLRLLHIG